MPPVLVSVLCLSPLRASLTLFMSPDMLAVRFSYSIGCWILIIGLEYFKKEKYRLQVCSYKQGNQRMRGYDVGLYTPYLRPR